MPLPTCPECHQELGWRHSFSFWNPWDFPCPHCKAALEASRLQKLMFYAVIPAGVLLAAVPITLEQLRIWQTSDSLVYFGVIAPVLILAAAGSWLYTTFSVKTKQ